ncbi:hypothetical protein MBAV_004680 [Candidatus Magnetobacterium bavaricum]|uniref:Uncharacterized protein n=1 Tax=Candidatus Magnetobacterium bavaricum TaxID=29290 RepID=A0A0F3GMS9_9BACT|nr:hypothetical protein MBAV_004680 [Candidatus Magnetobacterium bavaricum]
MNINIYNIMIEYLRGQGVRAPLQGVLKRGGGGGARFSRSGSHPPLPQTAPFFPFLLLLLVCLLMSFILLSVAAQSASATTPVYLTVVMHNEEPSNDSQDYIKNMEFYYKSRADLKEFALMLWQKGAMLNFQTDWNFLLAVMKYDVGNVTADTNNKNILRWLVEDLRFEVDPHSHGTVYNYTDIALLISLLGVTPSRNVGGFIYELPYGGWEGHIYGAYGLQFPDAFWQADNLWGAATIDHIGGDDTTFGVWKPKDRYNFYTHEPTQRLLYIGSGCNSFYGIKEIVIAKRSGLLNRNGFYTASIFLPQQNLGSDVIKTFAGELDFITQYITYGEITWKSLSQIADIWRTQYMTPSQVVCNQLLPYFKLDQTTEYCPMKLCRRSVMETAK